jgi:hypothetical protein
MATKQKAKQLRANRDVLACYLKHREVRGVTNAILATATELKLEEYVVRQILGFTRKAGV